ncbi:MAG: hypothetical protein IAE90_07810 [Ignavibacteria bacterium]|nr:hypothetical protein [Ignavibacteria bacterium]
MHNILFALLMLSAFVCGGKNDTSSNKENIKYKDTFVTSPGVKPNRVLLPLPESMLWVFGRNSSRFDPGEDDIAAAEEILQACFSKESSGTRNPFFTRKLENYHRQFAGVILENGDKVIWINCFCYVDNEYFRRWKEQFVMVDGGGNCFFNVKVNLNTKQYYELMVNGNI